MANYEVCVIVRPDHWQPTSPDSAPDALGDVVERLGQFHALLPAVKTAIEFNTHFDRQGDRRWAVVVDPASASRRWSHGRVCTPLEYRIASVWWPAGWEPEDPLDVPNCVLHAHSDPAAEPGDFDRASAIVRALNQQCMDQTSPFWYVMVAVEAEPLSRTITFDPSGVETIVEVKRFHVVRTDPEHGRGRCDYCPAREFDCANQNWSTFPGETTWAGTGPES